MKKKSIKGPRYPSSGENSPKTNCNKISGSKAADKTILCLILFLVFFTPLFLIPKIITHDTTLHTKFLLTGFVSSICCLIIVIRYIFFPYETSIFKDPVRLCFIAFAFIILISDLLSGEILYCLRESLKIWPLILIFLAIPKIINPEKDFRKFRTAILASGALVAVYGLCQYFDMDFLYKWIPYKKSGELARNYILSTIGNPEYLGSYLAPLILLLSTDIFGQCSLWKKILSLILFLIFIPALLLTGARGAVIGLASGIIFLFSIYFKNAERRKKIQIIGISTVLIIIFSIIIIIFSIPNPLNRHNQEILKRFKNLANLQSHSIKERILFHSIGVDMIANNPVFGVGEGMFRVNFYPAIKHLSSRDEHAGITRFAHNLKNRVADNSHNDYLQVWVEYGIFGFLAFTLGLSLIFAEQLYLFFLMKGNDKNKMLIAGFSAATLCLCINAATSFPMHTPTRSVLFWVMLGLIHTAALHYSNEKGDKIANNK
jgi:O-antigen ligase